MDTARSQRALPVLDARGRILRRLVEPGFRKMGNPAPAAARFSAANPLEPQGGLAVNISGKPGA